MFWSVWYYALNRKGTDSQLRKDATSIKYPSYFWDESKTDIWGKEKQLHVVMGKCIAIDVILCHALKWLEMLNISKENLLGIMLRKEVLFVCQFEVKDFDQ